MIPFKFVLEKDFLTTEVAQFVAASQGINRYNICNYETGEVIVRDADPADLIYFGDRNVYGYVFRVNGGVVCSLFIKCYGDECKD